MTTTMELRAELFQSINPLLDNESLLREVINFVKSLTLRRKEKAAVEFEAQHDTDEEIEKKLRQAFGELKDYKDGKIDFQSAEDFLKEWEDE